MSDFQKVCVYLIKNKNFQIFIYMEFTKEFIDSLPLSQMPEDYDGVEELTEQLIQDLNNDFDKIEAKYADKSDNTYTLVSETEN